MYGKSHQAEIIQLGRCEGAGEAVVAEDTALEGLEGADGAEGLAIQGYIAGVLPLVL